MNTVNRYPSVSDRGSVVAGLFHSAVQGESALSDLKEAGFTRVEISQANADSDAASSALPETSTETAYDIASEGRASAPAASASASPFFDRHDSAASSFVDELTLLGFSKHNAHDFVDGLVSGAALVTADAGQYIDRAVAILKQHGADIHYTAGSATTGAAQAQINAAAVSAATTDADREIQLRAERLVINKHRVQHGEARVRKEIVTEMKSFDVPVSHEELVIERHAVTDAGIVDDAPITDATIRIPLTEERVTISKETLVTEEVEVGTCRVEDVEHVTDTVRHEELHVNDSTTPPGSSAPSR